MVWEETLGIALLVLSAIFRVIVYYADKNVYLKYHDQKVVVKEKRGKKKNG